MASFSTTLRHTTNTALRRPLSLQSVRWASIVPYTITQASPFTPPPAPLTLEQALEIHQHKQMASLVEEQVKLEQSQRMRLQSELQVELAKHRDAILKKQELAALQRRGQEEKDKMKEEAKLKEDEIQRKNSQQLSNGAENGSKASLEGTGAKASPCNSRNPTKTSPVNVSDVAAAKAPYATIAASIVDPRYRTMFGYRGPEHPKSTPAELAELELKRREALSASIDSSQSLREKNVAEIKRISVEDRVQLAMMDYTPSQIEAMTPEHASAILNQQEQEQKQVQEFLTQEQAQQPSLTLKPTDSEANTCTEIGGTRTEVLTLVEDSGETENCEEEGDRKALRFSPDVLTSFVHKARGIHN
ncbi:hypothetical protein FBU30_006933 [Linnemannia zychae]|nr:hypothetical protein FBU30_006933 [Linnemannia zychae]